MRDRTANRHRWMRRVASGVRENPRLGTRQNSGRNFGIRPAPNLHLALKSLNISGAHEHKQD